MWVKSWKNFQKLSLQGITVLFFFMLTACAAPRKNVQDTEAQERLIKTAKINAQLGIAYLEVKDIQRAKHKLLLSLKQASNIPEPWYSMGYFLEATGNTDEAKKYYIKAIEIAPERGDAQNNYGTFLCRHGDYQTAIHHFDLAVKDGNYLSPADAYENAGLCALRIPSYPKAIAYFNRAIMQDPIRPTSLVKLSEAYYLHGNYKLARDKMQQFLTISPPTTQSMQLNIRITKKLAAQSQPKMNKIFQPIKLAERKTKTKATKLVVKRLTNAIAHPKRFARNKLSHKPHMAKVTMKRKKIHYRTV